MNEAVKNLMTRRSIRAFSDKSISREDLQVIVDAARYAPSGMNRQTWKFTVIQNKEKIAALAKVIRETIGADENYKLYAPDALILASNEKESPHGTEDCACALENIFLAANALGIGSVWINQLKGICDEPKVRQVLDELNLPKNHAVVGMAALGYAKEPAKEPVKRDDVVEWFL